MSNISRPILLALVAALVGVQLAMAVPPGGGSIGNVAPSVTAGLTGSVTAANNNNAVVETFTFTVKDTNNEKDMTAVKIVSTEATFGTKERTLVAGDLTQTTEPGAYDANGWKIWNPTANDGELLAKFQYTWPAGTVVGTYTQTAYARDEGAYVAGATTDTTEFKPPITVAADPVLATGAVDTGARWGAWSVNPGATSVEGANYLKITNSGVTAAQQFIIDWGGTTFVGVTDNTQSVDVDNNIQYAFWEDATPGTTAPNEGTYTYGSTSANGAQTFTFAATSNIIYVKYKVLAVPAIAGDQAYSQSVTVTEV